MKVIPANVHKGTADHKKHTEAFAKKKSLYPRLAYQWFYCGLDTSDCTGCKIKAKLVNSKDRVFSRCQG